MNKAEIKAELRRSACENYDPWFCVDYVVFEVVNEFVRVGENVGLLKIKDCRTFFLLVAEAL